MLNEHTWTRTRASIFLFYIYFNLFLLISLGYLFYSKHIDICMADKPNHTNITHKTHEVYAYNRRNKKEEGEDEKNGNTQHYSCRSFSKLFRFCLHLCCCLYYLLSVLICASLSCVVVNCVRFFFLVIFFRSLARFVHLSCCHYWTHIVMTFCLECVCRIVVVKLKKRAMNKHITWEFFAYSILIDLSPKFNIKCFERDYHFIYHTSR